MASQLKRIESQEPKPHDLTPSQSLAVAALVAGRTVTDAAEAAGVSRQTLYEWKKLPGFTAGMNLARTEQHEVIRGELLAIATSAIRALREMVESSGTPPAIRLRASLAVLSSASEGVESIGMTDPAAIERSDRDSERSGRWVAKMTRLADEMMDNA
jgi:translation initiation factor 2 alpha subunit (eIF-2alpha)